VLYLVPTPIGNLEDITLRALRILREVRLVLAEDTRTTAHLFSHHDIHTPLRAYTEHSHQRGVGALLELLAEADVALVSEAGMPGINDPGQALVAAAAAAGVAIVGLPGASAVPLAMAVSGFAGRGFTYIGFLPHRSGDRRRLLQQYANQGQPVVCFETPHRLARSLVDIDEVLGERQTAICRELTKRYEEIFRGTAHQALQHFTAPRGEFTIVIEAGLLSPVGPDCAHGLVDFLRTRAAAGESGREAVTAAMARFGVPRRYAYAAWEALKSSS